MKENGGLYQPIVRTEGFFLKLVELLIVCGVFGEEKTH
jgi:hypothetical protein